MTSQPNYPTVADQLEGLRTLRPSETHMEATDRVFRARTAPKRCTHLYCDADNGGARFATHQVIWPDEPFIGDAFVCDEHAENRDGFDGNLIPLVDAPPAYGPPAIRTAKAPGEYLVESIAVGDLVKPYRALFASKVEAITDLGGSIVLTLENGATVEQVWGHTVQVVATGDNADLADAIDQVVATLMEPMPAKPWTPPTWDCRTPSGHHFSMSFTDIAQRDAVEAHWLDRHDYCKACPDCDGCSHPDCGTCHCD